jgi:hypothetical protein
VRAMIVAFVRAWAPAAGDTDTASPDVSPDDTPGATRSRLADDGR